MASNVEKKEHAFAFYQVGYALFTTDALNHISAVTNDDPFTHGTPKYRSR